MKRIDLKINIVIMIFIMAFLSSACSSDAPTDQELISLKITISSYLSHGVTHIAEAEGYFAEYGLKMEYINIASASKAIPLLVNGDIDIYSGTLTSGFLNTVYQEDNIKTVADRGHVAPGECTYHALLIRKDLFENKQVTGPADLKGLTISGENGGSSDYLLSTYLSQANLTLEDIKKVDLEAQSEIVAYSNQALSGNTAAEPEITRILDSGEAVILARSEDVVGTFQTGIVAFNKKLLVDNPDIGARFLAAYLKGVQQYNEGKTERNLQILSEATGETIENLKVYCWPSFRNDAMIDFAGVDGFQQWSVANGYLDHAVTEEQFWNPSLLAAAQELLNP